jgi:hypothetical protein
LTVLSIALATTFLAGCATRTTETTTSPTCVALGANANKAKPGPIRYSSRNPKSRRFAGPDLAPDLATRNGVGRNLNCWK